MPGPGAVVSYGRPPCRYPANAHLVCPVKHVACPQCGTRVAWTPESRYRPFCSERCKLIDRGAWASESYRIPVAEPGDAELDAGADQDGQVPGKPER